MLFIVDSLRYFFSGLMLILLLKVDYVTNYLGSWINLNNSDHRSEIVNYFQEPGSPLRGSTTATWCSTCSARCPGDGSPSPTWSSGSRATRTGDTDRQGIYPRNHYICRPGISIADASSSFIVVGSWWFIFLSGRKTRQQGRPGAYCQGTFIIPASGTTMAGYWSSRNQT